MNREHWLTEVARHAVKLFGKVKVQPYRVTCGWPVSGGLGKTRRTVGQCFGAEWSPEAKVHEIFISPLLAKPDEVAGTLMHELCHVAAGVKANHGRGFVTVCDAVGLTRGRAIERMPGSILANLLREVTDQVGTYPHLALKPVMKLKKTNDSTVTLVCTECSCRVRMARKFLEEPGLPTCGCGESFMEDEGTP